MEENTEETGEQGVFPPVAHEPSTPSGKKYGSFLDFMNHQPKRAPAPPPKPQPSLHEHYKRMTSARERYEAAEKAEEARRQEAILRREELLTLEGQKQDLERQKASAIESGDKKKLTDLNQDIEIIQFQAEKIKTQVADLQHGEDVKSLLIKTREAEKNFYGQVLESYKRQVSSGKCDMPFSLLLKRAYALGTRCGVGDIKNYLFQWVDVPTLAGPDVEGLLQEIEEEYQGGAGNDT